MKPPSKGYQLVPDIILKDIKPIPRAWPTGLAHRQGLRVTRLGPCCRLPSAPGVGEPGDPSGRLLLPSPAEVSRELARFENESHFRPLGQRPLLVAGASRGPWAD